MCRNNYSMVINFVYAVGICVYNTNLGKNTTQTSQSKCGEMLFSDIHLCADYVSNVEEKYRLCIGKSSRGTFQRRIYEVLNESSLGLGM